MNKANKRWVLYLFCIALLMSAAYAQTIPTQPEGPTALDVLETSRRAPVAGSTVQALAGNVTQLSINGNTVTQTWQAYYGNVSGTILLDDALNNTIYNWAVASPEGEIYASESPIDFTHGNVFCYDFNATDSGYPAFNTLSEYEALLGLDSDDADGIDETFTEGTNYDVFYVGSYYVNSTCPTTQMYDQNEVQDPDKFQEVLLYDNTSNRMVYTAILEQDAQGFKGEYWDFEMIVGENGHDGDTTTTTYYFYVELE
ncbi:hypothetical protein KY359_04655 [Candidatus Woesearchaeota archaeon]|nr:hypothetical protein [Candidatus Woesearchaeota archaeon]